MRAWGFAACGRGVSRRGFAAGGRGVAAGAVYTTPLIVSRYIYIYSIRSPGLPLLQGAPTTYRLGRPIRCADRTRPFLVYCPRLLTPN
jgi:hypothetical protein